MTRCPFRALALSTALALAWPWAAHAQVAPIRTDGSTGPVVDIRGPLMLIPESLGKLQGANLFHSFQQFNIPTGDTARFTVQSPGVAHVISRVTGGLPSFLDGSLELKAEQGRPSFYFVNPAGVVFGSEARIDVPAGFHVSTAPQLQMADGSQWATTGGSSFSAAAPEAFGFLGDARAAPIVLLPGAVLAPARQSPAQLVAGDIDFSAAQLVGTGNLRLAAVGDAAVHVPLSGELPGDLKGDIRLGEGSFVFAASIRDYATGPIQIAAGNLTLSGNSAVTSAVLEGGTGAAGDLSVRVRDKLWVTGDSYLSVSTDTAAAVGDLRIQAGSVEIGQTGRLNAYSAGSGSSGRILIDAREQVLIQEQGKVWSNAIGAGAAGDILIQAPNITVASFGSVAATTQDTGQGGSIRLEAGNTLRLAPNAQVQAYSLGFGSTGAVLLKGGEVRMEPGANVVSQAKGLGRVTGPVGIEAQRRILLDGVSIATFGFEGAASADVGLLADVIEIRGNSQITAGSLDGNGAAGSIGIVARERLSLSGADTAITSNTHTEAAGGYIVLAGQEVALRDGVRVASSSFGPGPGGQVDVKALGGLTIANGAYVSTSTFGRGNAGLIRLSAADVLMQGAGAGAFSVAAADPETRAEATGRAGDILIEAERSIVMRDDARVSTSAFSSSSIGGDILIAAGELISLSNSVILSSTNGAGKAGRMALVTEGRVSLEQGARLSTQTSGGGAAGEIGIAAREVHLNQGFISSVADETSSGDAGKVYVAARDDLSMERSGISSGTYGLGQGGAVGLAANRIRVAGGSSIDAAAGPKSSGRVGNIELAALESIEVSGESWVNIANRATVGNPAAIAPGSLSLAAPTVRLDGASVFSDSTGNVAASGVLVNAPQGLRLDEAAISTRARDGNGGRLQVGSEGRIELHRSVISTSVLGQRGNGGDIEVSAQILWLDNGFVQANSAAQGGQGGVVNLDVGAVVASGNRVTLGGQTPLVFDQPRPAYNAIQAVAPDGVNGAIVLANPLQDLSASLAALDARLLDPARLGQNPCDRRSGSSLALSGRGGLAGQALPGGPPGRPAQVLAGSCP